MGIFVAAIRLTLTRPFYFLFHIPGRIGSAYLKDILGDLLTSVVMDTSLNLEIDPTRSGEISPEERANRIQTLKEKVVLFAERIMSAESRLKMPREVRAIAGFTNAYARVFMPDKNPRPLIGGFVMLRFVSPGIVTPESFDLLPPGVTPDLKSRRNLIMIAKLLQNMSNAVSFAQSGKEERILVVFCLIPCNLPFLFCLTQFDSHRYGAF